MTTSNTSGSHVYGAQGLISQPLSEALKSPSLHPSGPRPMPIRTILPLKARRHRKKADDILQLSPNKLMIAKSGIEAASSTRLSPTAQFSQGWFKRSYESTRFIQPRSAPLPLREQEPIPASSSRTIFKTTTESKPNLILKPSRPAKGPRSAFFIHQGFMDILDYTKHPALSFKRRNSGLPEEATTSNEIDFTETSTEWVNLQVSGY